MPEAALPEDMWITKTVAQHLVVDGCKASELLGWRAGNAAEGLRRSVRWHLAHPPDTDGATLADGAFSTDDTALAAADPPTPP